MPAATDSRSELTRTPESALEPRPLETGAGPEPEGVPAEGGTAAAGCPARTDDSWSEQNSDCESRRRNWRHQGHSVRYTRLSDGVAFPSFKNLVEIAVGIRKFNPGR